MIKKKKNRGKLIKWKTLISKEKVINKLNIKQIILYGIKECFRYVSVNSV